MIRPSRMHCQKPKRRMRKLDLNIICDVCGMSRAHGNHQKCSKQRQAINAELHLQETQE
ncbi:hypothetical protein G3435_07030 [Pseudomonas sp. MAFF212428]|uniref:Uncharacterized protein n=1 Tax=Pseudomonas brassicae TaxID=2708063 RepID=A0A6B3NQS7_9PSED|nr:MULTISPECIES: hypothetical protein [Pseudomonas]MEC6743251.1 hypothetical protein [Pseudomonas qingdaonensis]NER59804.1 hypothetical protein [Pseudomonas brassicae]NER64033.1 hypothetical protein [Pseudomonas brassicae]